MDRKKIIFIVLTVISAAVSAAACALGVPLSSSSDNGGGACPSGFAEAARAEDIASVFVTGTETH